LPKPPDSPFRDTKGLGGFGLRKPRKVLALDNRAQSRIPGTQTYQCLINGQNPVEMLVKDRVIFAEGLPPRPGTAFESLIFAGMIDQNLAHGTGRKAEEMATIGKIPISASCNLDVGLMDQVGCIQRPPVPAAKLTSSENLEIAVEQSIDLIPGDFIATSRNSK